MDKYYGDGSAGASGLGSTLNFMRAHPVTGELYATTASDKLYIFTYDGAVRLNKYNFPSGICTVKSFDWDKNGDLHLASNCAAPSVTGIVKWTVGSSTFTIVAGRNASQPHFDGESAKAIILKDVKAPAQLSTGELFFGGKFCVKLINPFIRLHFQTVI